MDRQTVRRIVTNGQTTFVRVEDRGFERRKADLSEDRQLIVIVVSATLYYPDPIIVDWWVE